MSRSLVARIVMIVGLLIAVVLVVRYGGAEIRVLEAWVACQGDWAPPLFLAALVVLLCCHFPASLFAIAAGLMFGVGWDTLFMFLGTSLAAGVAFVMSRWFLRECVQHLLDRYPKLLAIERAVNGQGLRLQLLLCLSPINPIVVSFILGATPSRVTTVLAALGGLVPALFVETYFGALAGHVGKVAARPHEYSAQHTSMMIAGFVISLLLFVWIGRVAYRAVIAAEAISL